MYILILGICLLFSMDSDAKGTKTVVVENFQKRLDGLANAKSWYQFVQKNPNLFSKNLDTPTTVVTREELKINGKTHTIGLGHRQALIKTQFETYKTFLSTPGLFRYAYGLDGDSHVQLKNPMESQSGDFFARIQKKVPGIEDQDFTLKYSSHTDGNYYFIRAPLFEDKKEFAVRDNLKVLEKTKSGTIVREISIIYPLRWWVRALGPTMRDLMKDEMTRVSKIEKCILEQPTEKTLLPETATTCWNQVSKN